MKDELPEPTEVLHGPVAIWALGPGFRVLRERDHVALNTPARPHALVVRAAQAAQVGAALIAAARWSGDVVAVQVADDRPRIDHEVIVEALATVRPAWMTVVACDALAASLVEAVQQRGEVVIVRHGKEWTP